MARAVLLVVKCVIRLRIDYLQYQPCFANSGVQNEAAHCNETFNDKLQHLDAYNVSYRRARLCQYELTISHHFHYSVIFSSTLLPLIGLIVAFGEYINVGYKQDVNLMRLM